MSWVFSLYIDLWNVQIWIDSKKFSNNHRIRFIFWNAPTIVTSCTWYSSNRDKSGLHLSMAISCSICGQLKKSSIVSVFLYNVFITLSLFIYDCSSFFWIPCFYYLLQSMIRFVVFFIWIALLVIASKLCWNDIDAIFEKLSAILKK